MECLSLIVTIGTCRNTRNVTGAQRELLKYYASITSNRWLMLKIFGVLIIFVSIRSSISKAPTQSAIRLGYIALLSSWSSSLYPNETGYGLTRSSPPKPYNTQYLLLHENSGLVWLRETTHCGCGVALAAKSPGQSRGGETASERVSRHLRHRAVTPQNKQSRSVSPCRFRRSHGDRRRYARPRFQA